MAKVETFLRASSVNNREQRREGKSDPWSATGEWRDYPRSPLDFLRPKFKFLLPVIAIKAIFKAQNDCGTLPLCSQGQVETRRTAWIPPLYPLRRGRYQNETFKITAYF